MDRESRKSRNEKMAVLSMIFLGIAFLFALADAIIQQWEPFKWN